MEKPNWRVWRLKRDVKVWEVCVLALGFEPSKNFEDLAISRSTLRRGFPTHEIAKKYEDLLEVLTDNLSDEKYFNTYVNFRRDKYGNVRLDEFIAWAISKVDWLELPPELAALVSEKTKGDSAQTQAKAAPVSATPTEQSVDEDIASLFDGVGKQQLAAMFNAKQDTTNDLDLWTGYIQQANKNELKNARTSHGKYNPYKAGLWWLDKKKPKGWTLEKLNKRLAKNLPERSKGNESRLTGEDYN